eukprot:jgi/Pico_ML_1/53273/g3845.t1
MDAHVRSPRPHDHQQRVCYLNVHKDEVIRSLFYNKSCNAVITVSVYASENYSSLKCRSVPVEFIRRGQPDAGFPLFESESLKWPGFVEFDDVNGKVLTFSALDSIYKVFDLKNYNLLFEIRDSRVQEIKISPGIMLLIFERMANHVPLKILSIEDGTELKAFNHLLHRNKKIDFIEQFNEKLLVKQENENLQILDVLSGKVTEVNRTEFMTPSAFIFLYENQLFLTFRESTVGVWNFKGELVTSFEDHLLWHPDCNTNNIYINTGQDMIISYCRSGDGEHDRLRRAYGRGCKAPGSINVSNILTGASKERMQQTVPKKERRWKSSKRTQTKKVPTPPDVHLRGAGTHECHRSRRWQDALDQAFLFVLSFTAAWRGFLPAASSPTELGGGTCVECVERLGGFFLGFFFARVFGAVSQDVAHRTHQLRVDGYGASFRS